VHGTLGRRHHPCRPDERRGRDGHRLGLQRYWRRPATTRLPRRPWPHCATSSRGSSPTNSSPTGLSKATVVLLRKDRPGVQGRKRMEPARRVASRFRC